jgi:predicted CXXCH cytochrome family protein
VEDTQGIGLGIRRSAGMAVLLGVLLAGSLASAAKQHPAIPSQAGGGKETSAGGVASCVSCHADISKRKVVHPAISEIGCEACHEVSQKGGQWDVKLVAEGNDLCLTCHVDKKPPASEAQTRTHFPVAEGECTACHDPHGSEFAFMLPGSTDGTGEDNFCFTCHINIAELTKKKTVHGALDIGGCLTCHQTHKSGDPSKQEFAFHLDKSAPSLCLTCHDGSDKDLIATHDGQPFQKAVCTDCHNPHGSDAAKLIRPYAHPPFAGKMCDACHEEPKDGKVVLGEEGKQALCFMCHVDKEKQISTAKFKHTLLDLLRIS